MAADQNFIYVQCKRDFRISVVTTVSVRFMAGVRNSGVSVRRGSTCILIRHHNNDVLQTLSAVILL